MLKYRLIFGTLMAALFTGLILYEARLDGSLGGSGIVGLLSVKGHFLCVLVLILTVPAILELAAMAKKREAIIFLPIAIPCTLAIATFWYWKQYSEGMEKYSFLILSFILSISVLSSFVYQAFRYSTQNVLKNCSVTVFSILYLGLLCSFILGIRIDYGPWFFLMFIFTVKCSDIGAYTFGRLFGKHKMAPTISPGKTWEGLGGAMVAAGLTGYLFSLFCGIMNPALWFLFGVIFAVLGQMGDLAESMLKRDAAAKDSSLLIPGFGGILDVIDSPLATAPAAYAFFMLSCGI
jgi:phosphatidate cytidylyltransferase